MNPTLKRLLGATAAAATSAIALLGTGAGTADAAGHSSHSRHSAHCDRAERPIWSEGPSRNMTGHGCSLPDTKRRWYTVEIDTLVQPHHTSEYLNGKVDRTETLHDKTISCLGYTSGTGPVTRFGCPPG